jgi:hypothetical protein
MKYYIRFPWRLKGYLARCREYFRTTKRCVRPSYCFISLAVGCSGYVGGRILSVTVRLPHFALEYASISIWCVLRLAHVQIYSHLRVRADTTTVSKPSTLKFARTAVHSMRRASPSSLTSTRRPVCARSTTPTRTMCYTCSRVIVMCNKMVHFCKCTVSAQRSLTRGVEQ